MDHQITISQRAASMPASPIRKLVPLANQAKKRGIKVYHLNIGQPDFEIPQPLQEKLRNLTRSLKIMAYAPSQGEDSLIKSWLKYYQNNKISLKKEEILITTGGSEALILALTVVLDYGDEFLVFEPFYANYSGFGHLLGNAAVPVSLDAENGYHLPAEADIEARITSRTKAILFTNPNNPTGTVFTELEMKTILKIATKHQLFIITDETYRGLCFEGKESRSFLELAKDHEEELIVMVDSVSKRWNLCGARVGVIASKNKAVMESVNRFAQNRLSVASLEQQMLVPFIEKSQNYVNDLAKKYESRRNVFLQILEQGLHMKIHYPEGAFYTMVSLPVDDAEKFSEWLLTDFEDQKETVMVAPGPGFYATPGKGKKEVRVAFVLNEKELQRAANLLIIAVKKYNLERQNKEHR